jgi:hypothetical protein
MIVSNEMTSFLGLSEFQSTCGDSSMPYMDRTLSLPVQEFIRACERVMQFASNHNGLAEADCHAVIFHATALMGDLGAHCAAVHQHDDSQQRAA